LTVILYDCETWPHLVGRTQTEGVLRTGALSEYWELWKRRSNRKMENIIYTNIIIRATKSRRNRWVVHGDM